MPVAHAPVLDIDPFDSEVMRSPIACDTLVRETAPAVWIPKYGFWAVGRHQQVQAVFGDHRNFSSASGTGLTNNRKETPWRKPSVILEVDPPEHTRARKVLARILSPAALTKLRDTFQQEADRLVDRLVEGGSFDGASELAQAFAMKVMPDAVGLPEEGRQHLLPYANLNFNAMGPRNALYEQALKDAGDAPQWVEFQCRRENLAHAGFGTQIYEAVDSGEIDAADAALLVRVFLTAALDTTIFGMGLALHAFATHPAQWDILRAEPALARGAFDEVLRYTAPSPFIARTTTAEVEIDGVQLGAEEKVVMFIAAANRDPRRWENPDRFDVKRRATGHMAFGTGVHGCVGQIVARLEAEVVLNALLRKVRRFELAGEPELRFTNWLRGFARLPLSVTPA
jgi:hypothetical protein